MRTLLEQAVAAKEAAARLGRVSSQIKNKALEAMAVALKEKEDYLLAVNARDLEKAREKGLTTALLDRLTLNSQRIAAMAEGLNDIADLPDPVGEVMSMWRRPNGLQIGQVRVPIGVIGIIYEARPNVTVDAVGLCLKSGNSVILRGGSEAFYSNQAIVEVIGQAAIAAGIPEGAIQLLGSTDRALAREMMRLKGYIDVLIPRGGAGLIKSVIENASIPVIETGTGNCHIYIDKDADLQMANKIVLNAKVQRPGVCNAVETLLVDRKVASEFLPAIVTDLQEAGVEVCGCQEVQALCPGVKNATDEDWATEYLDYVLAIKVVSDIDEAIAHISKYGSGHSEAIVTTDYSRARRFLEEIDAAAVYVNTSTRFTDGFEFGFGAEIGISTQKLHARGPMGLKELTTTKYIIYGDGQIRG